MSDLILSSYLGEKGLPAAIEAKAAGKGGVDILEAGISVIESDPSIPYVGLGGAPNALGEVETDAAVMNGDTLEVGAIGALKGFNSTFRLARKVMEKTPHAFIVGEGAARFAMDMEEEEANMLSAKAGEEYEQWKNENLPGLNADSGDTINLAESLYKKDQSQSHRDTVIFLVLKEGSLFAGTSTSGWSYKYPGRLGDSPAISAGLYADSRHGACACTHTGELTIRAGTARSVILYLKMGASLEDACEEALRDIKEINTGFLGPVVIHAIDKESNHYVTTNLAEGIDYCLWDSSVDEIKMVKAKVSC